MNELNIFSERLKELRMELGMSQRQMAELVGCTAATLSAYEKGTKNPSLEIARNIAKKCNVSLDWLCGLSESKRVSEKAETYADIFRILVEVDKAIYLNVYRRAEEDSRFVMLASNSVVQDFLSSWSEMLYLYHNKTINEKLYTLWLQDKLKEYEDFKFNSEEDVINFLELKDALNYEDK